jgi:hypothetical protein
MELVFRTVSISQQCTEGFLLRMARDVPDELIEDFIEKNRLACPLR